MRTALTLAFLVASSAAWAQCANVNGMVCAPAASASLSGEATLFRGAGTERVSGVSSVSAGQRIVVADKSGALSLGGACQMNVPPFSSVTLSSNGGMICANGVRAYGLNTNISKTADSSGLNRFSGQACPDGYVRDPNTGMCGSATGVDPTVLIGGGVVAVGVVAGIVAATRNDDNSRRGGVGTVSP